MIRIDNLCKSYGSQPVLKNLSLHVRKGEIYGFIGKNGAGKSTTMNLLAELTRFDSGSCTIGGHAKKEGPLPKGTLGYLPEDPGFYGYMTGMEYLVFIESLHGKSRKECRLHALELMDLVKMREACGRKIEGYSRGMRQRLGLAAILAGDPLILLLDEPSSALDPEGRRELSHIIKSLSQHGKTIFISTHILDDIEKICDRIGLLHDGSIFMEKSVGELNREFLMPSFEAVFESVLPPQALKNLEKFPWMDKMEERDGRFIFHLKNEESARTGLVKALADIDIPIQSLNRRKHSLEDIFIRTVNIHE